MAPKKRAMRDPLCALDGDDSDASEDDGSEGADQGLLNAKKVQPVSGDDQPRTQKEIGLEALKRAGYRSGPSLLHIPKQPDDDMEVPSAWGTGKGQSCTEHSPTAEERAHMREIAAVGVAEEAAFAKRAVEHAEKLRQERKLEKAAKAQKKQLTFREKEKRKRDTGKQSSEKNYVEEEKRIAREHGCYHGFDS